MSFEVHWRHYTIFGDASGQSRLQSTNPNGTHAFAGGGWLGGDSTSVDVNGYDAAGAAPILAQYPAYDPVRDTTYWFVVFTLAPGASARAHIFATVQAP